MIVAFGTAAALGGYVLNQYIKKNNFKLKIVKIEENSGFFTSDKNKLIVTVIPVDGEMIEMSVGNAIKITNSNIPILNNKTLQITKIIEKTKFIIDVSEIVQNKVEIKIPKTVSGIALYQTSFEGELQKTTTDAIGGTAKGIGGAISDGIGGLLGVDPETVSYYLYGFMLFVVFIIALVIIFTPLTI